MKSLIEKFLEFLEEKRRNKLFRIIGPQCIDSCKTYDELVRIVKRKAPFMYLWRGQNRKDSYNFSEDLLNLGIVKEYFKDEGSNSKFSIQYYNLDYVRYKITDEGRKEIERLLKNKKLINNH